MKMFKEVLKSFKRRAETMKYPVEPSPAPKGYRGKVIHHPEKCTACGSCIKVCPAGVLKFKKVKEFDHPIISIDLSRCIFCKNCHEICPTGAIELIEDYELGTHKLRDLRT